MQAIFTKFLGPTNHRPSRVTAYNDDFPRGVVIAWDHALNVGDNHRAAVMAFLAAREWGGKWAMGARVTGYAAVCIRTSGPAQVLP